MSQASNTIKRSTAGIFMLLALLWLVMLGIEWRHVNQQLEFVDAEIKGVSVLQRSNALIIALGEYRGTCSARLAGNETFVKQCLRRQSEVEEALAALDEASLKPFRADAEQRRLSLLWQALMMENKKLNANELFAELTRAVKLTLKLNEKVYAFSNLKLDNEILPFSYAHLIADIIPNLQESLGQIRGRGASMMAQRDVDVSQHFTLTGERVLIEKQLEELLNTNQQMTVSGGAPSDLQMALTRATEQVRFFVEINIDVLSRQDSFSSEGAQRFFQAGTQPILMLQQFSDMAVSELNALLSQRQSSSYKMMSFIILAMVLLAFSLVFLYRRINHAFNAVEQSEMRYRDASDAKTQFLSNMSHELRTPLNGIYGVLQILDGDNDQPKHLKKLTHIALESTEMLTSLIGNILDLAKIERREVALEDEPFMISDILETYVPTFRTLADNNDTEFTFLIEPDCHLYWQGDKLRIMQIINNIVGNAIKFSPRASVTFSMSSQGDILKFDVRDTGIGMDQKTIDTLFDRFSQGDKSRTREFQGSGLGMAICKELLDMMGGSIEVKSRVGAGSEVSIELPLVRLAMPVEPEMAILQAMADLTEEDLQEAQDWRESHVLIVDDAITNLFVLEAMMTSMVKKVSIASSGFEALELLNHTHIDMLVSDISMPSMDGTQLLKRVRAYQPNIPAVALTGNVLKEDILEYRAAGFDEVLSKPVQKRDLQAAMEKAFILREAQRKGSIVTSLDSQTLH